MNRSGPLSRRSDSIGRFAIRRPLRAGRRSGTILIFSLAVLVVLSMLGVVFATMASVERSVSRNYVDGIRARMLAESGIQNALAELSKPSSMDIWNSPSTPPVPPAWVYFGDFLNKAGKCDPWNPNDPADPGGFNAIPVTQAYAPSFFRDDNRNRAPDQVRIGSRWGGLTGRTDGGSYLTNGDLYATKVIDLNSKINVNNNHPNLRRILQHLFEAIPDFPGNPVAVAAAIKPNPQATYPDMPSLRRVVSGPVFDAIRPYVTTFGWVDPKVVRPFALSERRGNGLKAIPWPYPANTPYRGAGAGTEIFAQWEMRPRNPFQPYDAYGKPQDFQPRSPINVNHAPVEVLVAALQDLKGVYVYEDKYSTYAYDYAKFEVKYDGSVSRYDSAEGTDRINNRQVPPVYYSGDISGRVGRLYETIPIPEEAARAIAEAIVAARRRYDPADSAAPATYFRSFQQFNRFVDQLPPAVFNPVPGWNLPVWAQASPAVNQVPILKDLIKANANPNVHLNELNPDESIHLWVDKTDLTYHTFEFSFAPMGYFEIQSAGWVLDDSRQIVAESTVTAAAKVFDVHRDTTQYDFMKEWADVPAKPLTDVFSRATGPDPVAFGTTLMSYPEYQLKDPRFPTKYPSGNYLMKDPAIGESRSFDGYLGLNTMTLRPPNGGGAVSPSSPYLTFDHDGRTPDAICDPQSGRPGQPAWAGGYVREREVNSKRPPLTGASHELGPYLEPLLNSANPGSVGNDGILCERGSSPGYSNEYFEQDAGTLSFWVKPHFRPENSGRWRTWFSLIHYNRPGDGHWTVNPFGVSWVGNHFDGPGRRRDEMQICQYSGDENMEWPERTISAGFAGWWTGWEYIGAHCSPTVNHVGHDHSSYERGGQDWGNLAMQGRWMHVGFTWDDQRDIGDGVTDLYLNGIYAGDRSNLRSYQLCQSGREVFDEPDRDPRYRNPNRRWGPTSLEGAGPYGRHDPAETNCGHNPDGSLPFMRLGAEAQPPIPGGAMEPNRWSYNYTADSTIDSFVHYRLNRIERGWSWEGRWVPEAWGWRVRWVPAYHYQRIYGWRWRWGRWRWVYLRTIRVAPFWRPIWYWTVVKWRWDWIRVRWTSAARGAAVKEIMDDWRRGRYYRCPPSIRTRQPRRDDAWFTSPEVTFTPTSRSMPPVGRGPTSAAASPTIRLGTIAYTGIWSMGDPGDPVKPDLSETVFRVEIVDADNVNNAWMQNQAVILGGTAVTDIGDPLNLAAKPVDLPGLSLRYRVGMNPNVDPPAPLLATPILDDVTITYYAGPPVILSWVVGGD